MGMKFVDQFKRDIEAFVERTGLKPYKLANMAGVPPATIYRFLKGERPGMSLESYIKIKKAMSDYLAENVVWTPGQKEVANGKTESTIGR